MTASQTISPGRTLLTGGSGLLGTELRRLAPELLTPARSEFDLENGAQMAAYLQTAEIDAVLHGAAATSPPTVEKNPVQAMRVNIAGTAELAALCHEAGLRLVYISTDYIFKGDRGQYREDDELLPQNAYAWSKLGGESAVHMAADSLIIRTSFSPAKFPFPKAFIDQYTSRDSVEVIAPIILDLTLRPEITGIVHVGTERKSVKDLAVLLGRSDVADLRREDVDFPVPYDTSLDLALLKSLQEPE